MKEINASSFDLEQAGALSHRLAAHSGRESVVAHDAEGAAYPRFQVEPSRAPARRSTAETQSGTSVSLGTPLNMKTWEVFLAWSIELCRARAGFVVDSQGFVIASRGNVPTGSFDGIGAELCYAMEQLDKIDPDAGALRALELQYEGRRLMSLRAESENMGRIVVGFVGSKPLGDDLRETIVRQLRFSLPDLS